MSNSKSTKEILSDISSSVYASSTSFKFDKRKVYSEKYKKGNLAVYDWVSELCYYYLNKERNLFKEFNSTLKYKKEELSSLEDSEFKDGLYNALKDVEDIIKKNT